MISPSEKAPVCSGGQLELTCATTGDQEWRFDVFREFQNASTASETSRIILIAVPSGQAIPLQQCC